MSSHCEHTGNECGEDTIVDGGPCGCPPCKAFYDGQGYKRRARCVACGWPTVQSAAVTGPQCTNVGCAGAS